VGTATIRAEVMQDRRQPRPAIRPRGKTMERLERLGKRFLDEIFRRGAVAFEPQRQSEQPIGVR
jgi:hypothetical protein